MPYMIVGHPNSKYCVHKQNVDGSAGEEIACHELRLQGVKMNDYGMLQLKNMMIRWFKNHPAELRTFQTELKGNPYAYSQAMYHIMLADPEMSIITYWQLSMTTFCDLLHDAVMEAHEQLRLESPYTNTDV